MRKLKLQELRRKTIEEYKSSIKTNIVVVCDNIRSGMNIGSVFRTGDAFAVSEIYLTGISSIPPNKEINKTAIGAVDSVEWKYYQTTREAIENLKKYGYKIIIIEQTTESIPMKIYNHSWEKLALVFGNEINGVSDDILDLIDLAIEIPQYGTKHSLNVSVCAGIVLNHFADYLRHQSIH